LEICVGIAEPQNLSAQYEAQMAEAVKVPNLVLPSAIRRVMEVPDMLRRHARKT